MATATASIQIRFFAAAATYASCRSVDIVPPARATLKEMAMESVLGRGADEEKLSKLLDVCSFLIDGKMYRADVRLEDIGADPANVKIEVLPPFAGG